MEIFMKDNGKTIKKMGKELINGLMEITTMATI
jgi:hypothetical protein